MGLFEEQLAHSIYLLIIIADGDAMAGKSWFWPLVPVSLESQK